MPASVRRFTVNESQIKKFTLAGGSVHGAVRRLSDATERTAVFIAPSRTGALAASISSGERWSNGRQSRFTVRAGAAHASYVLKGTKGPIWANGPARVRKSGGPKRKGTFTGRVPRLPVGKSQGEPMESWTLTTRVAGQKENNFLMRAVKIAMKVQGYL